MSQQFNNIMQIYCINRARYFSASSDFINVVVRSIPNFLKLTLSLVLGTINLLQFSASFAVHHYTSLKFLSTRMMQLLRTQNHNILNPSSFIQENSSDVIYCEENERGFPKRLLELKLIKHF